jgi:hypothetical protein
MFTNAQPPRLPDAPAEYDQQFMAQMAQVLRLYFEQLSALQQINIAKLNIDVRTLPTQADVAGLRSGDVYVDTSAGNVLKIKP